MIKNLISNLLHLVPSDLRYEICRHHSHKEFAENQSDFFTNGELWLMKHLLPDVKTVFDVGAHRGEWATHALRINPNIHLHCFEPSRKPFLKLQGKNFGENVSCSCIGLGSENRQMTLFVLKDGDEGNSLYFRKDLREAEGGNTQYDTESVQIRTLDSYCQEKHIDRIDFMKLDVEGAEFAVIEGGKECIQREIIQVIQFEYGGTFIDSRTLLKDFFDFFNPMNYCFFLLYPNRLRYLPHYDRRLENFQYKNFLIVNNNLLRLNNFLKNVSYA
jgi:FkbM family methyltransferase